MARSRLAPVLRSIMGRLALVMMLLFASSQPLGCSTSGAAGGGGGRGGAPGGLGGGAVSACLAQNYNFYRALLNLEQKWPCSTLINEQPLAPGSALLCQKPVAAAALVQPQPLTFVCRRSDGVKFGHSSSGEQVGC